MANLNGPRRAHLIEILRRALATARVKRSNSIVDHMDATIGCTLRLKLRQDFHCGMHAAADRQEYTRVIKLVHAVRGRCDYVFLGNRHKTVQTLLSAFPVSKCEDTSTDSSCATRECEKI